MVGNEEERDTEQRETEGLNTQGMMRKLESHGEHRWDKLDMTRTEKAKTKHTEQGTQDFQNKTGNDEMSLTQE